MVASKDILPGDGDYGDIVGAIDDQVFESAKEPSVTIPEVPKTPKGHPDLLATSALGMLGLIGIGTGVKIVARQYKKRKAGE